MLELIYLVYFRILKDAKRRVIESVLEKAGQSERTTDDNFETNYKQFKVMIDDINECGAIISSSLVNQVLIKFKPFDFFIFNCYLSY